VAGKLGKTEENTLQTLLILDALRGTDSTGVAVIDNQDTVKVAKALGNPYELLGSKAFDKALLGANRAIIGHNRYGTQGKINKQNAHPFEFDSLVGAHNGTLTSKHRLDSSTDFDVDSENLYHHIHMHGLHSAMEHLSGAWSLVWWNKDDISLNFLRNKERPMYITSNVAGTALFWASEKWMLEVAMSRNGIYRKEIEETQVDMHYEFIIGKDGVIDKPHVTSMASRRVPFVQEATYTTWKNGQAITHSVGSTPPLVGSSVVTNGAVNNVVTIGSKKETAPSVGKKLSLHPGDSYVGSKHVSLTVQARTVDNYSAAYYICQDVNYPERVIRLYIKPEDIKMQRGDVFRGDIGALVTESTGYEYYYKVLHSSVVQDVKETYTGNLYLDGHGNEISLQKFYDSYGQCASCTGWVDPDRPHKFTFDGEQAVCDLCCEDPQLGYYVRLR
jgi:hypothetical protein